ncbi:unnamed protein product, partial [Heterosigma akashiwo]
LPSVRPCTTILVGSEASATGSPMVTHNADCDQCDFRINKVPAQSWNPAKDMRPIYYGKLSYPRLVSSSRGETWKPGNLEDMPQKRAWENSSIILDHIPQVESTFALLEGLYGIMNEHQVAIGESSCGSMLTAPSSAIGGHARITTDQLSQIALERCSSAREAVQLIGKLAVELGFYGPEYDNTFMTNLEAGDALGVIDAKEAWLMHLSPDDTQASAIWVAQRLPDNGTAIVSNKFVIKEIDPKSEDFLFSSNIWDVANRTGLANYYNGKLHFSNTFWFPLGTKPGILPHHTYSSRRMWNYYRLVKPSLLLTPYPDPECNDYPWYVVPDFKISERFLLNFMRNHFEGTPFDMTEGLAAGPYGISDRFDFNASLDGSLKADEVFWGLFERPVSMFRASYSFLASPKKQLFSPLNTAAKIWFSQYDPSSSVYIPLYVSIKDIPPQYTSGSLFRYEPKSFFWAAARVGNYARNFHMYTSPYISKLQTLLEDDFFETVATTEEILQQMFFSAANDDTNSLQMVQQMAEEIISSQTLTLSQLAFDFWRDLFGYLLTHWHDGYQMNTTETELKVQKLFYPKKWLEQVGYFSSLNEEM